MMTTDSPSEPVEPTRPAAQADDGGGGPLEPVPYDPALDELAGVPAEQVLEKKQSRAGRNLPAADRRRSRPRRPHRRAPC